MVSSNILQRIVFIRNGNQTGTGFTIEIENRQYLITARHVVPQKSKTISIDIYNNNSWKAINLTIIPVTPDDIDIVVLSADFQITPAHQIIVKGECYLSEEVYFLGFPFGLRLDDENATSINNGLPIPFVKRAVISSFAGKGHSHLYVLDGFNNPGFSGGPVVRDSQDINKMTIIAVVSSRHVYHEQVMLSGQPTKMTVPIGTGLMVAYPINRAIESIKRNPIGFELKK